MAAAGGRAAGLVLGGEVLGVRVLVLATGHAAYGRTGEVVGRAGGQRWLVRLDNGKLVELADDQLRPVKQQP